MADAPEKKSADQLQLQRKMTAQGTLAANAPFIEREEANALAPQEKQKESQEAETSPPKNEPTRKTSAIDSPFKLNFNLIASDLGLRAPENINQSGYGTEAHGLSEAVRKAADHGKGSGLA